MLNETDFRIGVDNDQPLEDGSYKATLVGIEQRDTRYGADRLMWRFRVEDQNTEIVGWTSRSPSKKSKGYQWATTCNPAVASQWSWGASDVVGSRCVLVVKIVEGEDGQIKNKILEVKPHP